MPDCNNGSSASFIDGFVRVNKLTVKYKAICERKRVGKKFIENQNNKMRSNKSFMIIMN